MSDRRPTPPFACAWLPLAIGLALACGGGSAPGSHPPDIVFITIDTLRADHLGSYGYAKETSPRLDAFAERATLFEVAVAQAPNTIPSVLQIMTSRYGLSGRVKRNQTTLAELLQARGYETIAIVDNPLFEFDAEAHGLRRGFERFYRNALIDGNDLEQQHYKSTTPADVITAQARRALASRDPERPLFLWLHYFDPHDPYAPPFAEDLEALSRTRADNVAEDLRSAAFVKGTAPAPTKEELADIVALYDAEIRYVDGAVGQLLDSLEEAGRFDASLVVVSSDHGESLGEHGVWMHGRSLYESEVRIPLIVKWPEQTKSERVATPVQAIDIAPTIAEVGGVEVDIHFDGTSLRRPSDEPALIVWRDHKVVRTQAWKLYDIGDEAHLFRIADDPGETRNVADDHPEVVAELRARRDARLARAKQSANEIRRLTNEAAEQMRTLGYIE